MDYYWKALREQLHILGQDQALDEDVNLEFIRVHALAIVQLCDQIMSVQGNGGKSCGASAPRGGGF